MFLAIQNKVIIGVFKTRPEADKCISAEKDKDKVSIMLKKSLRKLFLKDPSNFALHRYCVIEAVDSSEVADL